MNHHKVQHDLHHSDVFTYQQANILANLYGHSTVKAQVYTKGIGIVAHAVPPRIVSVSSVNRSEKVFP